MLSNHTGRAIKLAEPVPSSSHWYARSQGRWLWRASNGAGGSLVDAGNPYGRVAVYPAAAGKLAGREGPYLQILTEALGKDRLDPTAEPDGRWPTFAGAPTRG